MNAEKAGVDRITVFSGPGEFEKASLDFHAIPLSA
jgi:hypothetical protein